MFYSTHPNNLFGQQISPVDIDEKNHHQEIEDQLGRAVTKDISTAELNNFVERVSEKLIKIVESQLHQQVQV
jgi:hypothetical protein